MARIWDEPSLFSSESQAIVEAAQYLDLLAVVETMPAEMTGFADVVLPDTTYLERYDALNNPPWREPFASIRQPVVKPKDNSNRDVVDGEGTC